MRLVLPPRSAWGKQSRCHREARQKASNEAGCEQARFLSGGHMGKQWDACPNLGAVRRIRDSEGAAARPDKVTRQEWGATDATKRQTKMGNLTAQRKFNNSTMQTK